VRTVLPLLDGSTGSAESGLHFWRYKWPSPGTRVVKQPSTIKLNDLAPILKRYQNSPDQRNGQLLQQYVIMPDELIDLTSFNIKGRRGSEQQFKESQNRRSAMTDLWTL